MLIHKRGDLLKSDCTVILHQANCQSVMGAGIARGIAQMYPEAAMVDRDLPFTPEQRFGNYSYAVAENGVTIGNLYGQLGFGSGMQTNYEKLGRALNYFLYAIIAGAGNNISTEKIGVPYGMGAGLGGGDWSVIEHILERASKTYNIDIYVYKLDS